MKKKWVCEVCNSINQTEASDPMICYVCGSPYEEKIKHSLSKKESKKDKYTELDLTKDKGIINRFFMSLAKKIKNLFSVSFSEKMAPSKDEKITGWEITHSDSSSNEAYLIATPIYSSSSKMDHSITGHSDTAKEDLPISGGLFKKDKKDTKGSECDIPWPDHSIIFNMDNILKAGFTKITRSELNGVKGYKVITDTGNERFLTLANLKMLGFATRKEK